MFYSPKYWITVLVALGSKAAGKMGDTPRQVRKDVKRLLKAARPGALSRKQLVKELLRERRLARGSSAGAQEAAPRKTE